MSTQAEKIFSNEDAAILQEVMNIAFGKASADLAEVIDIRVALNVPHVEVMNTENLPKKILEETKVYDTISIVEQNFWGKFKGSALLAFPSKAGKGLVYLFDDSDEDPDTSTSLFLEKEALLEVGNILIGACVGKVAELLEDIVSFSPPKIIISNLTKDTMPTELSESGNTAVLMKTIFHFEDKDISGFLFLIASEDSMKWLKTALNNFVQKF